MRQPRRGTAVDKYNHIKKPQSAQPLNLRYSFFYYMEPGDDRVSFQLTLQQYRKKPQSG